MNCFYRRSSEIDWALPLCIVFLVILNSGNFKRSFLAICFGELLFLALYSSPEMPTYAEDIAPIIRINCIECHQPDGIGPFSLTDFESVRKRARQISEVVEDRFMPPWKPADGFGPPMLDERRLTDSEFLQISKWYEQGSPAGDLSLLQDVPLEPDGWRLGEPDLVIEMEEPYLLDAEGEDTFRNFVLPIPIERLRYVKAVEFRPRSKLSVHHAIIALDPTSGSRELDAIDPKPGYESMDMGGAVTPFGHLIGWAPGQVPYQSYPGTSWRLVPGTDLVVQLHLLPSGKEEEISPRIGLHFTDEPPSRISMVVQLRETDIDIAPGQTDYEIEESFKFPVATKILGLFPHAHYLGKDIQVLAELPDGSTQWLLRIPDWDFNWQSDYRYVEPLPLPAETRLIMRYRFDNSVGNIRNPSSPPKRVNLGNRSYDEMAEVALQVILEDDSEWAILQEAQARYDMDATPVPRPSVVYSLAQSLKAQEKFEEAIVHYSSLLERSPNSLPALLDLAESYSKIGNIGDSIDTLEKGSQWHGGNSEYRFRQAKLYEKGALNRTAIRMYLEVAAQATEERKIGWSDLVSEALYNTAVLYGGYGEWKSVEEILARLLVINPEDAKGLLMSSSLAFERGDIDSGRSYLTTLASLPIEARMANETILEMLPFPVGALNMIQAYANIGDEENVEEFLEMTIAEARKRGMNTLVERIQNLSQ